MLARRVIVGRHRVLLMVVNFGPSSLRRGEGPASHAWLSLRNLVKGVEEGVRAWRVVVGRQTDEGSDPEPVGVQARSDAPRVMRC